ncbi:hypothetical protein Cgig2_014962 [Carnegiea gigantea]|uniref:Uncharacterized protein n=1 Tax=Carnegiea gigantea TaxID=171969 RepID=A0A9Q1GL78_9CARY|nr:hypothetical protein Cgig2_014962 [Carnegiea gigantea]
MGFPRSLTTDEMTLYVLGNFEWYRREVVFPPRLLPTDYEEMCLGFVLAEAEEYARDYEVVFLAMLLNDVVKLGVLHGWMIMVRRNRGRILEARRQEASSDSEVEENSGSDDLTPLSSEGNEELGVCHGDIGIRHPVTYCRVVRTEWCPDAGQFRNRSRYPYGGSLESVLKSLEREVRVPRVSPSTEEVADNVRETFRWHWRSASHPLRPLPEDYRELCPCFTLSEAEEAAHDFNLPEMVQATFYAMLLNDAMELGIASGFIDVDLKVSLEGLRWTPFKS